MMDTQTEINTELTLFFKALADAERLQIAGALARQPLTLATLSAALEMKPAALLRHLALLMEVGLVRAETYAGSTRYALELESARALAKRLMPEGDQRISEDELPEDEYDRTVLRNYLRADGTLKEIPLTPKRQLAVLRHIAPVFEPGRRYTEKQVNERLSRFHTDVAALRRYLVDFKFVQRTATGSEYWRE